MESNFITRITIENIWNRYGLVWDNLHQDVNILIGINGSGKTTIFRIIDALMKGDTKILKGYGISAEIELGDRKITYSPSTTATELKRQTEPINYCKVATFDIPLRDRPTRGNKGFSLLYSELYSLVYDIGGEEPSFSDYRLRATNFPEQAAHINERIQLLFETINRLFDGTGKIVKIDPHSNHVVFIDGDETIELHQLSSGEKQLLLILIKVFLMDEKDYILLMDEPEISLHIEWQHRLFEEIRLLNPNCQIITSTHSPSIFGDGWGDKLVFVHEMFSVKE